MNWWFCDTHGPGRANAWGCPECVLEMSDEINPSTGQYLSATSPRTYRGSNGGIIAALEDAHANRGDRERRTAARERSDITTSRTIMKTALPPCMVRYHSPPPRPARPARRS